MKERFEKFKIWMKKATKEVGYFLSSAIFLKNFGGIVTMFLVFMGLTMWWLNCYTKHGESLHVHDYIGMDLDEAIAKAGDSSFEIFINDSTFIPGQPPNVILTQNPKPLSQVKKNRKIYVSVTKKIAELVALPALRGGNDDYDNFNKKCKRKFVDTKIREQVFSNKIEPNTILRVFYNDEEITEKLNSDGYEVPKGSTVEVVVTKRGGGSVPIPELVCKKYDAATFLVGNFNLNIGSVIKDNTVTDESSAYVWRQEPRYSASARMRVGEQINIYLTQFKPKSCSAQGTNVESPDED